LQSAISSPLRRFGPAFAATVLVSVSFSPASAQNAAPPNATATRLVGEWTTLCRTPSLDQITKWLTTNLSDAAAKRVPAQQRARDDVELCTANGGLREMAVKQSEPNTISAVLRGLKSDIWFEKRLEVNAAGQLDRTSLSPTAPLERTLPKDAPVRTWNRVGLQQCRAGVGGSNCGAGVG